MNGKQFCFIICVSDDLYREECLTYIRALEVPEGYSIDVLTVEGATSMCAGYNEAMRSSEAKYKIYLHQDVFLRERQFLRKLLEIFSDPTIGMIGMVGTEQLSSDAVMWNGQRVGNFPGVEEKLRSDQISDFEVLREGIRDVMAVDGLLIATQTDIPWREDLFDGWDFYDISQSMEFRRAGYRVVVPAQQPRAWFRHDAVTLGLDDYEKYRKIFLKEYGTEAGVSDGLKRILYPLTKVIRTWDIPYALKQLGMVPLLTDMTCSESSTDQGDADVLSRTIRELHADAVMTHDYEPFAALACAENDIPYIAWIWDSLQSALFDKSVTLPGNYIFDFDRMQAADTRARGAVHVWHKPLAANVHQTEQLEITDADVKRFACDIAFVGSLYSNPIYKIDEEALSKQTREEIRQLMDGMIGFWDGKDRFTDVLSDTAVAEIIASIPEKDPWWNFYGDRHYVEQTKISRRAANLERMEMLRRLSGRDIRLYTWKKEKQIELPGVRIEGGLDYITETPKAFYLSKINLNITLRSIRSGVPLRIFDIMASGGFVLTNYQSEIEDLFEIGRDLEVFHSFDELTDKVDYYLTHEKERLQIALNGNIKVRENYSYEKQVGDILDTVSAELRAEGKEGLR